MNRQKSCCDNCQISVLQQRAASVSGSQHRKKPFLPDFQVFQHVRVWKKRRNSILPFSILIVHWGDDTVLSSFNVFPAKDESQVVPALHTPKTVGFFRWNQIWNNVQHDGLRWNVALPLRFKYTRVKNFWFRCCLCEMPMPLLLPWKNFLTLAHVSCARESEL